MFALVAAWMVVGPFYRQVLNGQSRLFPKWTMFMGVGVNVIDVRFLRRMPDGELVALDHFALLGYADPLFSPTSLNRFTKLDDVHAVARQLCRRIGSGADVRIVTRVGSPRGWRRVHKGEVNLCLPGALERLEGVPGPDQ